MLSPSSAEHIYMTDLRGYVHSVLLAPLTLRVAEKRLLRPANGREKMKLEAHYEKYPEHRAQKKLPLTGKKKGL